MFAIVALALLAFAYTMTGTRENFTDPGVWTADDGTLGTVAITEDGTLWGTAPADRGYTIWRKMKGGSWTQVRGNAKQVDAQDANNAVVVGTDDGLYKTTDGGNTWANMSGGRGKWISIGDDGYILAVGVDENVYEWTGSAWVNPSFRGMLKQVSVGMKGVAAGIGGGLVWELVNGQWNNTGAGSTNVAVAKNGLTVEVSTDGNVYYKMPGKPFAKFEGSSIRQLSASTTKIACVTNDNRVWTKDISGGPPPPAGPSASMPAAIAAGDYSASCANCSVIDGKLSCSCNVAPRA